VKKRSVYLRESDMEYLEYVAKEIGKSRGELMREILEREVKKYKLVFGKLK
jgi:predicted DNA-binding protein